MTSKPMPTSQDSQKHNTAAETKNDNADTNLSKEPSASRLTVDSLIDAQVNFMQQWLHNQAEPLAMEAWQ